MAQPATSQSVNPSDPTTKTSGRPARQDDINTILRDLQTRITSLEAAVNATANVSVQHAGIEAQARTGAVQIGHMVFDVLNPSGAQVLVRAQYSDYINVGTGSIGSYLQIDGDDWSVRGRLDIFYFNTAQDHRKCCFFEYITPTLAPGNHTFSLIGKSETGVDILGDGNDWYSMTAQELG